MGHSITEGADVFTADDERVGKVDQIVVDPLTMDVSHFVVRKGFLFREDTLVPVEAIGTSTPERIVLDDDVRSEDLLPFVEYHYVSMTGDEKSSASTGVTPPLVYYGPFAMTTPVLSPMTRVVRERNIPERSVAIEAGCTVTTSHGNDVGTFAEVVLTDTGVATHVVVDVGGFGDHRKAVPIGWVAEISDDEVRLGIPKAMVDALPELDDDIDIDPVAMLT